MEMGAASISLAHNGRIPHRTAANGKTPIPSNKLPNVTSVTMYAPFLPCSWTKCPEVRGWWVQLRCPTHPSRAGSVLQTAPPWANRPAAPRSFTGLVRFFTVSFNGRNDELVDVCRLPFWVSSCCQQAHLRVAPRPKAQAVKPAISFSVFLQPNERHAFVGKAPRLDQPQGFGELGECRP